MKSFKELLYEYREFQRTDKTSSVSSLHSSGAYEPNSKGYIHFITYHGGNFGERPGAAPTRRGFARTPDERLDIQVKRMDSGIRKTPGQPYSSVFGLSTTPDATAAREYRMRGRDGEAPYVSNPTATTSENDRLYELHGRVHRDNVKLFKHWDEFDDWHTSVARQVEDKLKNDKKFKNLKSFDEKDSYRLNAIHRHITDTLGVHVGIIGTDKNPSPYTPGSGRARYSGEIMLFTPRDTVRKIIDRTNDVDLERKRIQPALERLGRVRDIDYNRVNAERDARWAASERLHG